MQKQEQRTKKRRSPQYPLIGLGEAVDKVQRVYDKEYQTATSREVIAKALGYNGLNGASVSMLSSIAKYGLLEGRKDEIRVSDLAMKILYPTNPTERSEALQEVAGLPTLFQDLDQRFDNGKASDTSIKSYLLHNGFVPDTADIAIKSYRKTKEFLAQELGNDKLLGAGDSQIEGHADESPENSPTVQGNTGAELKTHADSPPPMGTRRAIYNLDEGDVIITYPENLSPESVDELQGYIDFLKKKAERMASKAKQMVSDDD